MKITTNLVGLITVIFFITSCSDNIDNIFNVSADGQNTSNTKKDNSDFMSEAEDQGFFDHENEIKMEEENGVKYVWIKINGISLRFIFDTGASDISISSAEFAVLFRQGTLRKEDILDVEYFRDATGKITAGRNINLREVQIGSKTLKNVSATVVNNIDAPLLLGQSVLERFGSIEILNKENLIILK